MTESATPQKRAKVEILKEGSEHLRGTIKATLDSDASHFSEDEYNLLKFHGVYQQDDRDRRPAARAAGHDREWMMMIRAKIPGGVLTADQYLAFDDISSRYADGTLRATTRQCFQLHHVLKGDLKRTIRLMNDALVTTLGACGDVERNLMACPAPDETGLLSEVQRYALQLSDRTLPRTRAYHEIWLDHEKILSTQDEQDPLYGETYLPRKFKSGLAVEGDNCIDVYSQDVGMVAHLDGGSLAGFTILAGGGLGMTHGQNETHPRLGDPICFVKPDELLETFLTIIEIQRDNGNRGNRRRARMKYLMDDWGLDRFREELSRRLGRPLAPARDLAWPVAGDHLGWHKQHNGQWYLGVWIENGRIQDADGVNRSTAFRELVKQFQPEVRLSAQQNILFTNIDNANRTAVEQLLRHHDVPLADDVSNVLLNSMACPAIPTCGLALAESERAMPSVIRQIDAMLSELGLVNERLSVRMTGCPNGCARPYIGDVGFVGRTLGKYQIYVGGDFEGTRLNTLLADLVPTEELTTRLRPLFLRFRDERQEGEGFGDFCHRVGVERLRELSAPAVSSVG